MFRTMLAIALCVLVSAPARASENSGLVTGTVTYRQRSALPPNSLLRVVLQDVSKQDIAAPTIAEISMSTGSAQVPISFALPYAPTAVDASHRYALRATISSGGVEQFATAAAYFVLTNGATAHADLVLVPFGAAVAPAATPPSAAPAAAAAQTVAPLAGTHWKLVELAGAPPTVVAGSPEAFIEFQSVQSHIAAVGGCNRLMGSYDLRGSELTIAAGGMTMMACPDPLGKQELAFTDALRATKSFRIDGGTLELLDGDKVLARFARS